MKKIVLVLLTTLLVISCKKEGYEINGTIKGVNNGEKIYIETLDKNNPVRIDTAVIENNKFHFEGKLNNGLEIAILRLEEPYKMMALILENGVINVTMDVDTLKNSKIGGTTENDIFQQFNDEIKAKYDLIDKFKNDNKEKMEVAQKNNDSISIKNLLNELKKLDTDLKKMPVNFINEKPSAFVSVLFLENLFKNSLLTPNELTKLYNKIDKKFLETKSGKELKLLFENLNSTEIGSIAPDFSGKNPEGKEISLKESLGKVTIIDFWASWCEPCRVENPNVVAMYKELHDKGLNIIGVSLDNPNGAQAWKDAIAKDGLMWNQVSNLQGWKDPIAVQYKVQSIPATFILNKDGAIVAKNLRGEELKAKVKELLGVE